LAPVPFRGKRFPAKFGSFLALRYAELSVRVLTHFTCAQENIMKNFMALSLVLVGVFFVSSCGQKETEVAKPAATGEITVADLKTEDDRISYSIGFSLGSNLRREDFEMNLDVFQKGIRDAVTDGEQILSEDEIKETMMGFHEKIKAKEQAENAKKMEEREQQGEANMEKGKKFLEENKSKDGVVTLESGLQYTILEKGTGASPGAADVVTCHYKGTTIEGVEFDSSYKRGEPATFALNRVIKGWTEGVQLMKEGGKWQFFIPSELAYGERGAGPTIGPNEVLIFEVELVEVKKPETANPHGPS
jgi:FKBP-type peptidyl-prolyl cis-trans isomerase FklB